MNFADRLTENTRNTVGMDEKRITAAEFDDAVVRTMDGMAGDEKIKGKAKLIFPLIGSTFAAKMKKILFGEEK